MMKKLDACAIKNELDFSHNRCEYTIIKKIVRLTKIPSISLQGCRLKYQKAIQYLGVIFDNNLNWIAHLNRLKEKGTANIAKFSRIQDNIWGAREETMKMIYLAVIEKQITYEAEIRYQTHCTSYFFYSATSSPHDHQMLSNSFDRHSSSFGRDSSSGHHMW